MAWDITTIGSATVDFFADTDSELIRIETRTTSEQLLAFPLGEKVLVNEFNITTGGGGTNTAVAFKRLGLKTAFLGKVGSDVNGDYIIEQLAALGVDFVGCREGTSGASIILNGLRNDRTILAYKGTNNTLRRDEFPAIHSPWVYLASMLEQSWDTVVAELAAGLDARRFRLAFNPSSYQAALGYERLRVLTDKVSFLVMNREEACRYLGLDPAGRHEQGDLVQGLVKQPGMIAAVTDGAEGAWVCDGAEVLRGKSRADLKIAETTGAGDAFASTFTACLVRELPIETCLHYAMTNAESVLQHKGAKERLLTWDELRHEAGQYSRDITRYNAGP
jgi:ribokinase